MSLKCFLNRIRRLFKDVTIIVGDAAMFFHASYLTLDFQFYGLLCFIRMLIQCIFRCIAEM